MGSRSRGCPPRFGARPCVLTASRRTVIMPADLPTLQRSPMPRQRLSSTGVTECGLASVRLRAGELHHLGPLLSFLGNQLFKVDGRTPNYYAAQIGNAFSKLGISEARIDLRIKVIDDLRRCGFRCAEAEPVARFIPRHEFTNRRSVRQ